MPDTSVFPVSLPLESSSSALRTTDVAAPQPVTPLSILARKLEQLVAQTDSLPTLGTEFKQELESAARLASGLDPYVEACTTPESAALAALTQRTQAEDWSRHFSDGATVHQLEQEMLSGHAEGQLLKLLLHAFGSKRVLEVGMFTGYSALAMAEALPNDGILIACELDEYVSQFAQDCFTNSPHGHKIQVKVGPAIESMQALADAGEQFDFIFIDANKDGYVDYFNLLLDSSLLTDNAVICVDNTLMQGVPYGAGEPTLNGAAIAHFNKVVAEDSRVQQVLLPLRDGVTLIRRV